MKGHSAAAGLAGGSCGRERSVRSARVEERRQQRGGGRFHRVFRSLRALALAFAASSAPSAKSRCVGLSGLSSGRGELRATRTTALVAAVTTASADGEDERVRKGSWRGPGGHGRGAWVGGQGERCEEETRAKPWRRDIARLPGSLGSRRGAEARPAVGGLEGRRRQGRESTISAGGRVCTG